MRSAGRVCWLGVGGENRRPRGRRMLGGAHRIRMCHCKQLFRGLFCYRIVMNNLIPPGFSLSFHTLRFELDYVESVSTEKLVQRITEGLLILRGSNFEIVDDAAAF